MTFLPFGDHKKPANVSTLLVCTDCRIRCQPEGHALLYSVQIIEYFYRSLELLQQVGFGGFQFLEALLQVLVGGLQLLGLGLGLAQFSLVLPTLNLQADHGAQPPNYTKPG